MTELFDKAAKAIVAMKNDVDKLRDRYGKDSKFVTIKEEQLHQIISFYDHMVDALDQRDRIISLYQINYNTMKVLLIKHEMNASWSQLMLAYGVKKDDLHDMFDRLYQIDDESDLTLKADE